MNDTFLVIVLYGLASGVASTTITQSKLFAPLRQWILRKWPGFVDEITGDRNESWIGTLITCPYCMGHWVSLLLCVIGYELHIALLINWLAVTAVSVITSGLISKLYSD